VPPSDVANFFDCAKCHDAGLQSLGFFSRVLLNEWEDTGVSDERGSGIAKEILLKYARTFHYDCQRLKRAMVVWPQLLARCGVDKDASSQEWVRGDIADRGPSGATFLPCRAFR